MKPQPKVPREKDSFPCSLCGATGVIVKRVASTYDPATFFNRQYICRTCFGAGWIGIARIEAALQEDV